MPDAPLHSALLCHLTLSNCCPVPKCYCYRIQLRKEVVYPYSLISEGVSDLYHFRFRIIYYCPVFDLNEVCLLSSLYYLYGSKVLV